MRWGWRLRHWRSGDCLGTIVSKLIDQYEHNVSRGPHYEGIDSLGKDQAMDHSVRYIAYYLPQFHAIPENDKWWGTGFTDWTNVTKVLPRYIGHYQPRLPADLGFYDLANAETLRRQVSLAKRGGIYGFCIHNYWFSGKLVLETPLRLLLENPDIDMPFCLNWANESWSRRWDGSENDVLLEQHYGPRDDVRYVESVTEAVRDRRYIRINGRPLLMLYRPGVVPDARATVERWRDYFMSIGLGDPYILMAQAFGDNDPRVHGMDAAAGFPPHNGGWDIPNEKRELSLLDQRYAGHIASYDRLAAVIGANRPTDFRLFPGVCPQWDNEARKPGRGFSFHGSTPAKYGAWLKRASGYAATAPTADERIVFINAWNEWAEGAYLEPDRHFGFAYLAETRRVLDGLACPGGSNASECNHSVRLPPDLSPRFVRRAVNRAKALFRAIKKRLEAK